MLAFGIKPTPFHFGLLLNITHHCGLGSPKSMHDLLFSPHPQQLLLDEQEIQDKEEKAYRGPSFLSSINTSEQEPLHMITTSNDLTVTVNENQQLISTSSSEIIEHQDDSTSSELSSEWWQDPDDVRKGELLRNHLRPFSNANILKPNISYEEPNLVGLRMPHSPAERLMLLGGIPGVLKHMQECNVLPNNIIFTTLLNVN
jgi:hypothetical protein